MLYPVSADALQGFRLMLDTPAHEGDTWAPDFRIYEIYFGEPCAVSVNPPLNEGVAHQAVTFGSDGEPIQELLDGANGPARAGHMLHQ